MRKRMLEKKRKKHKPQKENMGWMWNFVLSVRYDDEVSVWQSNRCLTNPHNRKKYKRKLEFIFEMFFTEPHGRIPSWYYSCAKDNRNSSWARSWVQPLRYLSLQLQGAPSVRVEEVVTINYWEGKLKIKSHMKWNMLGRISVFAAPLFYAFTKKNRIIHVFLFPLARISELGTRAGRFFVLAEGTRKRESIAKK